MFRSSVTMRRTAAGVALILAPLCNWMAALLEPLSTETKAADVLNTVAAHSTRSTLSGVIDAIGVVFYLGVALTFIHLVAPRALRWAHVSGAMMLTGCVGFAGMHMFTIVQAQMAKSPDREAMIALWDKLQDSAVNLFVAMFFLGLVIGLISMSIALFKTRSIPRLLVPLIWVFLVWDVGLGIAGVDPQIAGAIDPHMVLFICLATLGLLVLRQNDEAWASGQPLTWAPAPLQRSGAAVAAG